MNLDNEGSIRSVAVIGAGASGAAAAAALHGESYFDRIRVFERRETPGGTWIYDANPGTPLQPAPGHLAPDLDPPLRLPSALPATTDTNSQERYAQTPVFDGLTTNVPAIAMAFSDRPYPYSPFVPHWIPKQCIQDYFTYNRTDALLSLNTTVEHVKKLPRELWELTLRRPNPERGVDEWWAETFDALIIANGHYTVPFIPLVPGLAAYMAKYPEKVFHSKSFRSAHAYADKRVLIIGNSASGIDISTLLAKTVKSPLYQSRRSKSRWDGPQPPLRIEWKPVITSFRENGSIIFADDTVLASDDIDYVIYCTGYQPSFPWWNSKKNGPLWDYHAHRLDRSYLHTFFVDHPTLGLIGMPRTLTFRSFEYQAVALARIFAGRSHRALPDRRSMLTWQRAREERCLREHKKFHDIPWENDETLDYFRELYDIAGLPLLTGEGRHPPVLDAETRWAVENIRKYPDGGQELEGDALSEKADEWVVVDVEHKKGVLSFI
nr:hypothetical protein B0A51_10006 [Rachicladosporium sp. CCFEE 5018]